VEEGAPNGYREMDYDEQTDASSLSTTTSRGGWQGAAVR
jgi:hypothetical protein